jgi:hypothetical protein
LSGARESTLPFFGREPEMDFLVVDDRLTASALVRALLQRASQYSGLAQALDFLGVATLTRETATASDFYSIRRIDGSSAPCWHLEMCPEPHWLDGLEAVTAAYDLMQRMCEERGVGFAVVLTPSYLELQQGRFGVIDALAGSLAASGIRVVDVRQGFRSVRDWSNVAGPDRHWTPLGHQIVADALAERLGQPDALPAAASAQETRR